MRELGAVHFGGEKSGRNDLGLRLAKIEKTRLNAANREKGRRHGQ